MVLPTLLSAGGSMSDQCLDESSLLEDNTFTLPAKSITVLVVDDHALVLAAISQVLAEQPEIKLFVTAQSYAEAERQAAHLHPDIIWLDMYIARSNSTVEIGNLRKISPNS